jgi:AraC family transcriptional regulator of adaptative response / DNA-3-methyladenine glycosylase II
MTSIAFAAGFSSSGSSTGRSATVYASSPTSCAPARPRQGAAGARRSTCAWHSAGRSTRPGCSATSSPPRPRLEEWRDGAYHRALRLEHGPGVVSLRPAADHVAATVRLTDHRDLVSAVARCRWLLDLDADPVAVDAALAADPALRAAVRRRRAARAALRRRVRARAAHRARPAGLHGCRPTVTGRLVAALGDPLPAALVEDGSSLGWTFPAPAAVAEADPGLLGMPRTRAATLRALAGALDRGELDLSPGADRVGALEALGRLPGVGPWTVASVAMRALGHPDAFPATDLGIAEAGRRLGLASPRELVAHSERWRPWRSYATQVLWGTLDHPINTLPPTHDEPTQRSTRDELDHLRRVAGRTAATDRARRRRPHPSPVRR